MTLTNRMKTRYTSGEVHIKVFLMFTIEARNVSTRYVNLLKVTGIPFERVSPTQISDES